MAKGLSLQGCQPFPRQSLALTLYHIIPTFNDPETEGF